MKQMYIYHNEQVSVMAATGGVLTALIACMACVGPLLGIALGVGSLGWLSAYSFLSLPASLVSIALMLTATIVYFNRKSCCTDRRKHLFNRWLLAVSAIAVVGVNVLEHTIIPIMF